MKTRKSILISIIGLIIAYILFVIVWNIKSIPEKNSNEEYNNNNITIENSINISLNDGITDECTDEWNEYNEELQAAFIEANGNINNENSHYLLKNKEGYIYVYYLDENNKELLYRRTTISVEYLSPEDIEKLKNGIEVIGIEELNKIMEDFE